MIQAILFACALLLPGHASPQNPDANQIQSAETPQPSLSPTTPRSGGVTLAAAVTTGNQDDTPNTIWQKAFGPETWPNWLLAVVGIVGVIIALRTLKAIEIQAEGTVLSERAWLIRPDTFSLEPSAKLDWKIANEGRTVARIIDAGLRCGKYDIFHKLPARSMEMQSGSTMCPCLREIPFRPGVLYKDVTD